MLQLATCLLQQNTLCIPAQEPLLFEVSCRKKCAKDTKNACLECCLESGMRQISTVHRGNGTTLAATIMPGYHSGCTIQQLAHVLACPQHI